MKKKIVKDDENQKKIQLVTKERIRHYLKEYPYLTSKIRQLELNHIRYSPSLDEYKQNINTIENQVIAMEEDSELQELRFYKQSIDRHLYLMKINQDAKYYNYLLWNYMKRLPKKEIVKRLGFKTRVSLIKFDDEIINYLYLHMKKEADSNGKKG